MISTNQPNIIVNRGRHPSLHESCQYQIAFANARFRIEYPPPYKCHVWNYVKRNVHGINKAISHFNWQGFFTNLPIIEQFNLFNSTLMKIFWNFIPHKIVTFHDQGTPLFVEKKGLQEIHLKWSIGRSLLFTAKFDKESFFLHLKMQKRLLYTFWKNA